MTTGPRSDTTPLPEDFVDHSGLFWRVVENQNYISSDRLVDDPADQPLLEQLIDEVKPPIPDEAKHLPMLLGRPFAYGHKSKSRFRRANERPGILYASEAEATGVAEMAYYRFKFYSRSPDAKISQNITEFFAFTFRAHAARALDLMAEPFVQRRADWTDPDDYSACQDFAQHARRIQTQMIRYESVRDPGNASEAIIDPAMLDADSFQIVRSWHFRYERGKLNAYSAVPSPQRLTFTAEQFGFAPAGE